MFSDYLRKIIRHRRFVYVPVVIHPCHADAKAVEPDGGNSFEGASRINEASRLILIEAKAGESDPEAVLRLVIVVDVSVEAQMKLI